MFKRVRNRLKFRLERMLVRGAHYRLLLMAATVGLIAALGGLLVWNGDQQGFDNSGEAIWWAFLRLTDPGYLGDDEGLMRRIISTALTILGYVLFMGALIAIMTQWLSQTISKLESGLTPIAQHNHILILGWTNRTPNIVEQLVRSEKRVRRVLARRGARSLNIVILAEAVTAELFQQLRDRLGDRWDAGQITLRSGNPLHMEHLYRVDFLNAATIILPGADFAMGGAEFNDTRTVKTLMSIAHHGPASGESELPALVTEIFDPRKLMVGVSAYGGAAEILASNSFIGRLLAQNLRHRGLSHLFYDILTHSEGNEVYILICPEFVGHRLHDLASAFEEGILLGAVRPHGHSFTSFLNPPVDFVLTESDRLAVLAASYEAASPIKGFEPAASEARKPRARVFVDTHRRILVLGWNHKVPALLEEFDGYGTETFDIDILSTLPTAEREEDLDAFDLNLERVNLRQFLGDFTVPSDLSTLQPETYDSVVILAGDRVDSVEAADARTVMGYLLLREILLAHPGCPTNTVVELMDEDNMSLFARRRAEILVSPLILSHVLGQVAIRRELRAVFEELFGPGGAEIYFRAAPDYDAVGIDLKFEEIQQRAAAHDEIAIGVRLDSEERMPTGGVYLNPDRARVWHLTPEDEVVVVTTFS